MFDQTSPEHFKFAALVAADNQVVVGHYSSKHGWVIDAAVARNVDAGVDYTLTVLLKGTAVSVELNHQLTLSHAFNAVTVDGRLGLFTRDGHSSFDSFTVRTDDPLGLPEAALLGNPGLGEGPSAPGGGLTEEVLNATVEQAIRYWSDQGLDERRLDSISQARVQIFDIPGNVLGLAYVGANLILIDRDAAGYGWSRVDLLSTVVHEIGHLLGFGHELLGESIGFEERSLPVLPDLANMGQPQRDTGLLFRQDRVSRQVRADVAAYFEFLGRNLLDSSRLSPPAAPMKNYSGRLPSRCCTAGSSLDSTTLKPI